MVCTQVDLKKAQHLIETKYIPALRKWRVDLTKIVHGIAGLEGEYYEPPSQSATSTASRL